MLIQLPADSPLPLHEQVAAAVRGAVITGDAAPGERLPAAKDLARSLGMNMHTVLRAYQTLRDEGVIEMRRGRGASIAEEPTRSAELTETARRLVDVARRHGLSPAQMHALLDSTLTGRTS